ncbi:alpha/beta-hydrolase [Polyporus arcularius HHB13444]|uniref:Alpha/beta-hydrolase n=1 Tax=Polyporus arcularius HHB13444 TaxID=1314778 RepID=A0A5C3P4H5_9APHY|nr:alpha/beta-hydrolase [Polyporus arcularius HHB13444]
MLHSLVALTLAASLVRSTRAGSNNLQTSQIKWGACDPSVVNDTSLSCGFLEVPLDYQDPSVGTARLALIKANATGERQGTVLFNPGGPGGSGLAFLNDNKDLFLRLTGGVYDVLGWDPRGVGNVTVPGDTFCFDNREEYEALFNGTVELTGIEEIGNFANDSDVQALLDQASALQQKYEEVGQRCLNSPNGKYLRYLGTAATVRDMVSIADALDGPETPINYLGISYGTLIGSWFVNMFPERVGRVVLDGIIDPVFFAAHEISTHFEHLLVSTDTIYKVLITGCALAGPAGCAAASEGDGPLDIDAKFQALLKAAYDAAKADPAAPLTSGQIRLQLYFELFSPTDWAHYMNTVYPALVASVKGEAQNNRSLVEQSRQLSGRRVFKRTANTSPLYTSASIYCADSPDLQGTTMTDVLEAVIAGTRNVSHMLGAILPAPLYQCSFWPVRSVERYQGPYNKTLANKILIASNTLDPVTSLAGAEVLAGLLGEDAVLVRINAFGHTTLAVPSKCMEGIIAAYMANGTLPANGTVCEVDADFEVFHGVDTAMILAELPDGDV